MHIIDSSISRSKRTFYVGMALATFITMLWGFAPTYYLRAFQPHVPATSSVSLLIHIHALTFTAWILLLFGQTVLVAAGRTRTHRRLGIVGAGLAAVMFVLGFLTTVQGGRDHWNPGGPLPDPLAFMIVGLFDMLLFSGFVGAGLYYRRQPELHKRLMLLGTIGGLMWPAITRMRYISPNPISMFTILGMLLLAMPVGDFWTTRRIHPLSLVGGLVILASFPLRVAIGTTDAWHHIATWLVR